MSKFTSKFFHTKLDLSEFFKQCIKGKLDCGKLFTKGNSHDAKIARKNLTNDLPLQKEQNSLTAHGCVWMKENGQKEREEIKKNEEFLFG